jgi:hypothetical protein
LIVIVVLGLSFKWYTLYYSVSHIMKSDRRCVSYKFLCHCPMQSKGINK